MSEETHPIPVGHIASVMFSGDLMAVEIRSPVAGRVHTYRVRPPERFRYLWNYRDPIWYIHPDKPPGQP